MNQADYPPCPSRSRLVMFAADGSKEAVFRCIEPSAPTANQNVTVETCVACPIRRSLLDGVHIPPTRKVQEEPSPDPGGGGFVPCASRGVVKVTACCGKSNTIRVCQNDTCAYFQGEVTPTICANCKVRN